MRRILNWVWRVWCSLSNKGLALFFLFCPFGRRPTSADVYYGYRLLLLKPPTYPEWRDWLARLSSMRVLADLLDTMRALVGYPSDWTPIITDRSWPEPTMTSLTSQLVTQAQLESETYKYWCAEIKELPCYRRKLWEFAYILQALQEHGLLRPGAHGLGFGVGKEPLVAVLAKCGCQVVATDLNLEAAQQQGWVATNQHSDSLDELNEHGICEPELFRRMVAFRNVDMNHIDADLLSASFDFVWSACALEHLGSLEAGRKFILESLRCLKPGGVAIHTTEYNLSSDSDTLTGGLSVIFRRRDIESLISEVSQMGYLITFNPNAGNGPVDRFYDVPPYTSLYHLRLKLGTFISTSIGLIIRKPESLDN